MLTFSRCVRRLFNRILNSVYVCHVLALEKITLNMKYTRTYKISRKIFTFRHHTDIFVRRIMGKTE